MIRICNNDLIGRIAVPSVLSQELFVLLLFRVLLGPEEKHMLAEVRQALDLAPQFKF